LLEQLDVARLKYDASAARVRNLSAGSARARDANENMSGAKQAYERLRQLFGKCASEVEQVRLAAND
jgi:hypothetical protein